MSVTTLCTSSLSQSIDRNPEVTLQDYSVSFSRRHDIQALIGDKAEFLVHTFCVMDLASLDATMGAPSGKHQVMARKQHGNHVIPLTDQQYRDLITVQLADWLEQVNMGYTPLHNAICSILTRLML